MGVYLRMVKTWLIKIWAGRTCQLFASCFVRHVMRIWTMIRVTKIGVTRLTHALWKCFVCPQNASLPIFIWLYSTKNKTFFLTFWKRNRYGHWMGMTVWRFGSVLIACDHAYNRSLTCGKDRATNCYSLIEEGDVNEYSAFEGLFMLAFCLITLLYLERSYIKCIYRLLLAVRKLFGERI